MYKIGSMAIYTTPEPKWFAYSHRDRYRMMNIVQHRWCNRPIREDKDEQDRTVYLDGQWITDVPSFYLSIGEAVNGPNGYFGGGLDALSDCLHGTFGVLPPLTVRLSHFDKVRELLDNRAWCRWRAERFLDSLAAGDSRDARIDKKRLGDADYLTEYLADADYIREQLVDWGFFRDGSPDDVARRTAKFVAAQTGAPFAADEYGSYFEGILEVLESSGAKLIPDEDTKGYP